MSGGVRNLRAMFENKEESSMPPPDRGRSPASSIGGSNSGTSPRPLSKVRTSFVAVERSGGPGNQWGLRKENSTDPSLATRRASFSTSEEKDPKAIAERNQSLNSELSARKSSAGVTEIIPEFAIETPPVETEKRFGYLNGTSRRGEVTSTASKQEPIPDKKSLVEEHSTKLPGATANSAAISSGTALRVIGGAGEYSNGTGNGKLQPASPTKGAAKAAPAGRTAKPGPISTAPSSNAAKASSKSTKSPSHPRTPTTPAKSSKPSPTKSSATSSTKIQTRPSDMASTRSIVSPATTISSKPAARSATSSALASKSEDKHAQVSSTGFHKPRPKSPTRPAKLPASMTAPTASSLSKAATAAPTGRQSLGSATKTVSRSRSQVNLSQKQELHRKPSKLDSERPALGRPSHSTLEKQPSRPSLPKQTAPADESFLTRMMRPTTSSASKTTEKIITPPRVRIHTRPATREGPAGHGPHHELNESPSSKKLPAAAMVTEKEATPVAPTGEIDDTASTPNGTNQPVPLYTEKSDAAIPNNTNAVLVSAEKDDAVCTGDILNDEPAPVTTSHDNENMEETTAKAENRSAPASATVTKDAMYADLLAHKTVKQGEPIPDIDALRPIQEDLVAEKTVDIKTLEDPASSLVDTMMRAGEPSVMDEPNLVAPAAKDSAKLDEVLVAENAPKQLKEDVTFEDTNPAA